MWRADEITAHFISNELFAKKRSSRVNYFKISKFIINKLQLFVKKVRIYKNILSVFVCQISRSYTIERLQFYCLQTAEHTEERREMVGETLDFKGTGVRAIGKTLAVIICLLLLLGIVTMPAAAKLDSWQYQRKIGITENSGTNLVDYQVLLDLSGSDFPIHAQSDGSDLKFVFDGKELSYWIEAFNPKAKTCKVWIKVPKLPAKDSVTVMMYSGNPGASSRSSGAATFEFFDDFEGKDLNTNIWAHDASAGGSYFVSDSHLALYCGGSDCNSIVKTKTAKVFEKDNVAIEMYGYETDYGYSNHHCTRFSCSARTDNYAQVPSGSPYYSHLTTSFQEDKAPLPFNVRQKRGIIHRGTEGTQFYTELENGIKYTDRTPYYNSGTEWGIEFYCYHAKFWIDWVRIRKYTASEPTVVQSTDVSRIPTTPAPSNSVPPPRYFIGGAAVIALILIAGISISRKGKNNDYSKPQPPGEPKPTIAPVTPEPQREPAPIERAPHSGVSTEEQQEPRITITSAFGYKGATILYKIKVKNSTPEPIGDIRISLFVPDVFLLKEKEKSIAMLEPNESNTVTFEIRPTGECGECNISGRVHYYDYSTKKRQEADIKTKSLSIVCPLLKAKKIEKVAWKETVSRLIQAEESTKEIQIPAETLFTMASRVIEDKNMFLLEPEVTSTPQLFNGVARFYAEGVKELKYAVQIEIVGGAKKSRLILKAWAEKEEALTGFYHGMLDELEKRVQVKDYIEDSIVQYNIGTVVKDSVVQRSTIGGGEEPGRKCPHSAGEACLRMRGSVQSVERN